MAWYNLGLSASEVWQAEEAEDFFSAAVTAFRKVLQLDTSKRAELRYLSAVALGRLLTRGAEDDLRLLPEALQHFGEAWRLVQEWNHPDLAATWGHWGKAQALQMKQQMESIEALNQEQLARVDWLEQLQLLSKLCEEAAEKLTRAQTAIDDQSDDGMDEEEDAWAKAAKGLGIPNFMKGSSMLISCREHVAISPLLSWLFGHHYHPEADLKPP